ncbi:MAG: sigma-70 family RNA polymerase sigma factor, partial [Muribaculaceae bacterium]|nr:sigma-70 family RNA polymerase sigma factor [Muribaculaceae bacterium]
IIHRVTDNYSEHLTGMTDGEFNSILIPQYRQMYATAFAILRDPDDASDAVQDIFSSLWLRHSCMALPENAAAFCRQSIRNHCIDRIRSDSKRYFERIDTLYQLPTGSHTDSQVSLSSTAALIMKCLAKLNKRHREVLTLSLFSQLSNDEISVATGESPENVRVILSRGRRTIKEYLKDEK